jgi:hypothetical protein
MDAFFGSVMGVSTRVCIKYFTTPAMLRQSLNTFSRSTCALRAVHVLDLLASSAYMSLRYIGRTLIAIGIAVFALLMT